jgi:hypothetical protein
MTGLCILHSNVSYRLKNLKFEGIKDRFVNNTCEYMQITHLGARTDAENNDRKRNCPINYFQFMRRPVTKKSILLCSTNYETTFFGITIKYTQA